MNFSNPRPGAVMVSGTQARVIRERETFEDIEAYGEERWLGELAERLKKRLAATVGDAYTLHVPALGATMADGGEKIQGAKEKNGSGKEQ